MWQRDTLTLSARKRGFHLISDEVEQALAEMPPISVGLLHV
ncbi:hypothetical protein ACFO0O_03410 [Cobetia amphilecti]|jgi:thiamine phosphate synthase YjbQ (UPF0047 family)|uniref:Uncharacterized protein n=2 Tax=Cobetia TaxID=204286 RepID=A0ABT6UP94_9GAMM|nr:hypothetical protein [Cobetia amphilecti]MDI5884528.1 hypothetical protein [Cobetia amphilecti]